MPIARLPALVPNRPPFEPGTLLLWGSPVLALAAGAGIVLLMARRHRPAAPPPLSAAERTRLQRLLDT